MQAYCFMITYWLASQAYLSCRGVSTVISVIRCVLSV